jgi:predicted ArsR family transcriptional regulator
MAKLLVGHGDDYTAQRAYRVTGSPPARLEVLRFVLAYPETTTAEVMVALNMSRNGVLRHLKVLADEGMLEMRHATHPRGAGPITYWRANVDEAWAVFEALGDHLFDMTRTLLDNHAL